MYAVNSNTQQYKIYFGGTYRENWTADYKMSVSYSERRFVLAGRFGGSWIPVGGDAELCALLTAEGCPTLTKQYFQAAATAYDALHDCLRRGLPLDRLSDFFRSENNPMTAPELARLLMDDCGFTLNAAYQTAAHCCDDVRAMGVDFAEMIALQPRTAHVLSLLRAASLSTPSVYYDSYDELCRYPGGATECGEELWFAFRLLGGMLTSAALIVSNGKEEREFPMQRKGAEYSCRVAMPEHGCALRYCFRLENSDSTRWLCPDLSGHIGRLYGRQREGFRLTVAEKNFETPKWFRKCVMYQIFPDRFAFSEDDTAKRGVDYHKALGQTAELHESLSESVRWQARSFEKDYIPDDFYGGTFAGIEQKLPYLRKLGINCIYLNPIVEARSNHRYDTADYLRPDPILGTTEDFVRLCRAAEKEGMRVILDGVFSHTGADSIYFNKYGHYPSLGACQGKTSEYYDWYDIKSLPDDYRSWWGFSELPEVEETNERWQDFVVTGENSVVKTWLRRGAAGWRLDVADELPDEVLSLIRTSAKAEKPDALILGEVWEDAVIKESYGKRRDYALGKSLDSVMNYPFRTALLDFATGRTSAYELRDLLNEQRMNYPKPLYYSLMNLLGSHDTDRLRSALATDKVIRSLTREEQLALVFPEEKLREAVQKEKMCAVVQFSIPGVPSIYYGDEQGMCGVCDPFNRLPFREDCAELHDHYAALAKLRLSADALSTGEVRYSAPCADVLLILRYITGGRDALGESAADGVYLSVVNRSALEIPFEADCREAKCGIYRGTAKPLRGEIIKLR